MDNIFSIQPIGNNKVLFGKLPLQPLTKEEALNIAAWLIIQANLSKGEVTEAVVSHWLWGRP